MMACLLVAYMPWTGIDTSDTSEPRLISAPPPACTKYGTAMRLPWTNPQKLVSNSRRSSSIGVFSRRVYMPTPASFTHVSIRPNSLTANSAAALSWSYSATSATADAAVPPAAVISATTSASAAALRATHTTLAPARANRTALWRPMPLLAPVINTTCSFNGFKFGFMVRSPVRIGMQRPVRCRSEFSPVPATRRRGKAWA